MTGMIPSPLSLDVVAVAGNAVLTANGDIDLTTVDAMASAGELLLEQHPTALTIDMAGVEFCDSAGINALVTLRNACEAEGSSFRMINLQPHVRRVLVDLTGLAGFLNIEGSPPRDAEPA